MNLAVFDKNHDLNRLSSWFSDPIIMKAMGMDLMTPEQVQAWTKDGKIILIAKEDMQRKC